MIRNHPGITWAQLANEAGYYDQSHMSRYVKEYLKVSPNTIVQLDMKLINYLLSR
jgi:AraC-like DNA-binding protein